MGVSTAIHISLARLILLKHLKESFVFLDHTQLVAGAFLYGFQALTQILHLGIQGIVALFFLLGFLGQFFQPRAVFADLRQTGIAEPQPILEVQRQSNDDKDQGFNGGSLSM